MELVSTMEISGEEREIADAVARGQINGINNNLDGLGYGENGVYNLLKPKLLTETTKNGVTCTPNKDANGNLDGTYTLKGTNSGTWTAFPFATIQNLGGTFKFVARNGLSNAFVFIWNSTDNKAHDNFRAYKEVTFDANKIYSAQFVLDKDGAEVNDLFKPMLTADLTATIDDFKPYIPSVKMLSADVSELKNDLSEKLKVISISLEGVTVKAQSIATVELPQEYQDAGYIIASILTASEYSVQPYEISGNSIQIKNKDSSDMMFVPTATVKVLIAKIG